MKTPSLSAAPSDTRNREAATQIDAGETGDGSVTDPTVGIAVDAVIQVNDVVDIGTTAEELVAGKGYCLQRRQQRGLSGANCPPSSTQRQLREYRPGCEKNQGHTNHPESEDRVARGNA